MTQPRLRRSSLPLVALGTVAVTAAIYLALPAEGRPPAPPAARHRPEHAAQEPPPARTLLDRLGEGAKSLFARRKDDPLSREIAGSLERLGVPAWHAAGRRGKGVKVAVLDSGFNSYREAAGVVLPKNVRVKSFRKDGKLDARESKHGVLCAEIVSRLAPDAEILLANWEPETPSAFLDAVRWAKAEGARVISCSMIMPSWSDGEGGGDVHAELTRIVGKGDRPGDALFVASAGNTALRHAGGRLDLDKSGRHKWSASRTDNPLRPLSSERVSVELTSPDALAVDLVVHDTTSKRDVAVARSAKLMGSTVAVLRFDPNPNASYVVRLRVTDATKGPGGSRFNLTVLGGKLGFAAKAGSIPFPGDGDEVLAVGATDEKGRRVGYSSCGPNGTRPKPDLAAVIPVPSRWRPDTPFSGTSAAAPQAAGVAALVMAAEPTISPDKVRAALAKAALADTKGHSAETGHGRVRVPATR